MYAIIIIFVFTLIFAMFLNKMKYRNQKEVNIQEKTPEQIEDELLFDPYTGEQITLEEAISGERIDDEEKQQNDLNKYLDKFSTDREKEEVLAFRYLNNDECYEFGEHSEELIEFLQSFAIFSTRKTWSYSGPYVYNKKHLFLLVDFDSSHYSQIVAVLDIDDIKGHYYLREKSAIDKIFEFIRIDDELYLENYECFTIEESSSKLTINKILDRLQGQRNLEIEIFNDKLLVKTLKSYNIADLKRLEEIANYDS